MKWGETCDGYLADFEKLCKPDGKFTSTGATAGELHLWSTLRDLDCVGFRPAANLPPKLKLFYDTTAALPGVVRCCEHKTAFGELKDYVVPAPE